MWLQKPPLGTPLDWSNPLNKGLRMHIAMNEGHGDKVQDLSMNGNHGTLNGFAHPPTVASGWNPGQTGVGLNFDGTNDYVNCGNNPILNITGDFSASFFMRSNDVTKTQMFVSNDIVNTKGYRIICASSKIEYVTYQAETSQKSNSNVIQNDTWYHIVVTRSGASAKIYINGVDDTLVSGSHINPASSNTNLCIGRYPTSSYALLDGSIDQTSITNRTWSAKEARDYTINPWQVYLDEDD